MALKGRRYTQVRKEKMRALTKKGIKRDEEEI
jgi:hypothetical protein